jgi:hypothetical protein
MPKGEKVLAQSKRTATPPIFKKIITFQIDILLCSKGGESSIFKIRKTLLNTKRRISLRGSFVLVKGKAFKAGEKISNLENASFNLIRAPLTICKRISKRIYKRICKNKTRGASVVQNF